MSIRDVWVNRVTKHIENGNSVYRNVCYFSALFLNYKRQKFRTNVRFQAEAWNIILFAEFIYLIPFVNGVIGRILSSESKKQT